MQGFYSKERKINYIEMIHGVIIVRETKFSLILHDGGDLLGLVVEFISRLRSCSFKTALNLASNTPLVIKDNITYQEATALEKVFDNLGAIVDIKGYNITLRDVYNALRLYRYAEVSLEKSRCQDEGLDIYKV
jgi:hypothetical protein